MKQTAFVGTTVCQSGFVFDMLKRSLSLIHNIRDIQEILKKFHKERTPTLAVGIQYRLYLSNDVTEFATSA